jgi:alkylated DNA repair dioxygenase AlkB
MAPGAGSLFGADLPPGFLHQDDFISTAEEAELAAHIQRLEFETFEMRGVVARRRVAFFGASYDHPSTRDDQSASGRRSLRTSGDSPSPPIPAFLFAVRDRLAAWAKVEPHEFAMALVNEYRPGTPIGWHRDAPQYDIVAGVSLLSSCVMRLRPYVSPSKAAAAKTRRKTTHEIELLPRSAYVIKGEARSGYEHSIPAVKELRYSITLRTLR